MRAGGVLPPWVTPRMDRALERAGRALLVPLSAGTAHRAPPPDGCGFPWTEALAGARYLVEHGVDPARILMEEASYDTIGNAYFSRMIHAIPRGFARLLVITSAFHMPRTEAIFRWVYGLEGPGTPYALDFEAVTDDGLDPVMLAARVAKEQASLASVEALRGEIHTLRQMHEWLFSAHQQYSWRASRGVPAVDAPLY
ncbi:hypothetical protein SBA3_4500007 [Candidatus Sulfopaludibacter sp. SbA3]|nr:hypothetical protein SBA3_4500007 [Candidatus Sulfopaludibacter sp. SbA3]